MHCGCPARVEDLAGLTVYLRSRGESENERKRGDARVVERYDAVVAGYLCLDIIPRLPDSTQGQLTRMFLPGRQSEVGPATFATGGAVSNTGLAVNILGIKTRLIGKVGDDLFGQVVRQIVGSYGSDLVDGIVVDERVSTAYTIVISPPGVDRSFLGFPGANATFCARDIVHKSLSTARLFHFGYPPSMKLMFENNGAQLAEIFRCAKETGVTTSLDTALPDPSLASGRVDWRTILKSTLPYVDLFLPSAEETLYMLRRETYDSLCRAANGPDFLSLITPKLLSDVSRELLEMGAKILCMKLGEHGLYLRTAGRSAVASIGRAQPSRPAKWADLELWAPCFEVDVVGTTGAGDATIAGFLSALLRDLTPEATLTAAVAVGACNVEADDALSGVRPWDETLHRIARGWSRHELDFDSADWRFDDVHQLWARENGG